MGQMNEARERMEEILNGKEYRIYYDESRNVFQEWWDQIKKWLADFIENLFPALESGGGAAEVVLVLIILGALLLLGIAIFLLVRNKRRNTNLSKRNPLHSAVELSWTYQKHVQEALKHEKNQDFSPATRHLFLALLLFFHDKEWLEAKLWKTNWEYYDELRKVKQAWADEFYDLALVFDEVAYGEYEIDQVEYNQFREKTFAWLEHSEGGKEKQHAEP
ncbi:DUF4129 domain-containing protein [Fredinandcohnia sp. QZ13]|uniref:DUF4129 domain-containing protein n=1 Tax=Fredinandcohnia sp. QZ13 TaxID=3073144 RepID=UPI002853358D|nr:DUF4129 domain-containing protein [Fredinandcohnia sp. QZ13]MDR4886190.1 DUF4129 domain-containing protein [Fredinandcohnia sp. QZ13]